MARIRPIPRSQKVVTRPCVFILESNSLKNEEESYAEGDILSKILHMSSVESKYFYFRTKREFEELLKNFKSSNYRYLHIACHGNEEQMTTTFDSIEFTELAKMLNPYISNRRIFFSACSMTNRNLADKILSTSGCFSLIGPANDIQFADAAVFWASFYTVMLRNGAKSMSNRTIINNITTLVELFELEINYFGKDNTGSLFHKKIKAPSDN